MFAVAIIWFGIVSLVALLLGWQALMHGALVWGLLLLVAGLGFPLRYGVPWLADQLRENQGARRERARQRALEREQHARVQQGLRDQLRSCSDYSQAILDSLDGRLSSAKHHLDRAEFEFRERAFTPFWQEIESAAAEIGAFADGLDTIAANVNSYTRLLPQCDQSPPPFDAPLERRPKRDAAAPHASRLEQLVRKAHKDFQFASIYEQRRSTRVIEQGLKDLRQVIDEMRGSIEHSFENLDRSVASLRSTTERGFDVLDGRMQDVASAMGSTSVEQERFGRRVLREMSRIRRKL